MQQIINNLRNGTIELLETPCPQLQPLEILIRTQCSLISSGTERMLVEFGKSGPLSKIKQQPDKVRQVLDKIATDGLWQTFEAVKSKLEQPLPMGYCNVGEVIQIGKDVVDVSIGDRVVSNAPHAELVTRPKNLYAKIPDSVANETAVFTVLGSVALQGIRLANPTLGEFFVVIGLGLIGLLTVQLLKANGCRVLGLDYDIKRLELAKNFGAEVINLAQDLDTTEQILNLTNGLGVDGVLIATATKSSEPLKTAALISRKRGRIILIGDSSIKFSRADLYEKELSFQVSCSYGVGRYDEAYENQGQDYPFGLVRWTLQRNFEAVLEMMRQDLIKVESLITHSFDFDEAPKAYELLTSAEKAMGIILQYKKPAEKSNQILMAPTLNIGQEIAKTDDPVLAVIGAGNYASRYLIPALKKSKAKLHTIVTQKGLSGAYIGKKYDFVQASTMLDEVLTNSKIKALVIATRHDSHAALTKAALTAGKHVFVEKPLCLNLSELTSLIEHPNLHSRVLMVGYNRRFSPHAVKIKALLQELSGPKVIIATINAGFIADDHWIQDKEVGGGRIIGEVCHFVDLLRYFTGCPIVWFDVQSLKSTLGKTDTVSIQLQFQDGSMGTIHYLTNGHRTFPKERLEIFCMGKVLQLDNFRKLRGYGWKKFNKLNLLKQNKGQYECIHAFINSLNAGVLPIPLAELFEVSKISIEIAHAVKTSTKMV